MTNAEKMFEELGYTKVMKKTYDRYDRIEQVGTPTTVLMVDRHEKTFAKFSDGGYGAYITIPELKAINEKCKELGWLND